MKYKKKTLKNGVRVLMIPIPESPTVTYMVWVNTGSNHEEKSENGISHFLEHMVFKGTRNRPTQKEIRKDLDGIGAMNNAFTSNEYTSYYAKAHPRHIKKIISVVSDMYLNATIPPKELEKERGVVLGEIDMYEDDPRSLVGDLWEKLTYGNQPAGRHILGVKENIKGFKQKDFLNYRKKHYVAKSTVVVIAGKFDEKKIITEIEKQFKNISTLKKPRKVKVKDSQKRQALVLKNKKTDRTHFIIGFRALDLFKNSKDLASLNVLDTILGKSMSSRLFIKFREELGLGYYVFSMTNALSDYGYLAAGAGVDNKRTKEAIKAMLGEIKKLKNSLVSNEELEAVKRYLIGIFPMRLEKSDSVAVYYGRTEILSKAPTNPKDVYKQIEKVTAKDIQKMAKKIFINKKMNMAIVGPHKDKRSLLKIFKI